MMFPRDTVLFFVAVAEYVTATKSDHPFADNHAMINSIQQKAISRRLKKSSKASSSKSSKARLTESPKAECSFKKAPKSSKSSKSGKSSKSSKSLSFSEDDLEDLDDILKEAASASDKGVLQSTLRALKKVVAADPTCHTGETADVIEACAGKCCTGEEACSWNDGEVATICDGACTGDNACSGIPANSVIMNDSCFGVEACQNLGGNYGADEFIPVFMGPGSCVDPVNDGACSNMGAFAETVVVAGASCQGDRACDELGEKTTKSIFVGPRSCDGTRACRQVADIAEEAAIFIGSDSCRDYRGCDKMAEDSTVLTHLVVGDESCVGSRACTFLGRSKASTIAIGIKSCLGRSACDLMAGAAATTISIGNGACDQTHACFGIGYFTSTSVAVGDCACIGQDFKCSTFGSNFAGPLVVESGECSSDAEVCCADSAFAPTPEGQCEDICNARDPSCDVATFTWSGTTTACADICQA